MEDPAELLNARGERPCWSCAALIGSTDNYCKNCGKGQGEYVPWQYKHWGIVVITLFGLGPFSLFFLWRSPVISRRAKFTYTAVITALTFYVLAQLHKFWMFYQAVLAGGQVY